MLVWCIDKPNLSNPLDHPCNPIALHWTRLIMEPAELSSDVNKETSEVIQAS